MQTYANEYICIPFQPYMHRAGIPGPRSCFYSYLKNVLFGPLNLRFVLYCPLTYYIFLLSKKDVYCIFPIFYMKQISKKYIFCNNGQYKCISRHLRPAYFKTFSNHDGKFKCISNYLKPAYFKILSIHGGQFKCISNYLRPAYFKILSNHRGPFKCISNHLRPAYFKIYFNHGGQFKCISRHLRPAYFKTSSNHGG